MLSALLYYVERCLFVLCIRSFRVFSFVYGCPQNDGGKPALCEPEARSEMALLSWQPDAAINLL